MKIKRFTFFILLCLGTSFLSSKIFSQATNNDTTAQTVLDINSSNSSVPTTNMVFAGVPFLLIPSNPVSSALGNANIAAIPNVYDALEANSKLSYVNEKLGFSLTYFPWLSNLNSSSRFYYLSSSGFYRYDRHTASFYFKMLNYGRSTVYNQNSELDEMSNNPMETDFSLGYAFKIKDIFSAGIRANYIFSRLHSLTNFNTQKQASSFAISTNLSYKLLLKKRNYTSGTSDFQFYDPGLNYFLFVLAINNIGPKLQYTDNDIQRNPLPSSLCISTTYVKNITELNRISAMFEFQKLLVPVFPLDQEEQNKYYESSIISSIGSSFGNGLAGTSFSLGLDYNYNDLITFRTGYFNEIQGNSSASINMGFGLKIAYISADFSYTIPIIRNENSFINPLFNTYRIGMSFVL